MLLITIGLWSAQLCAQDCSYSGTVTLTSEDVKSCSPLEFSSDANVTIKGDVILTGKTWDIAPGAIVSIEGSLTLESGSTINNNGTFNLTGTSSTDGFTLNAGTFNNKGRLALKNAHFTMHNGAQFINYNESVVTIRNEIADTRVLIGHSGEHVPYSSSGFHLQEGSIFAIYNTDMHSFIEGDGHKIAGKLHVVDGNLTIEDTKSSGSAEITIGENGGLYVIDTDLHTNPNGKSTGKIIIAPDKNTQETFKKLF
jgi:hypothetical protein